MTVSTLMSSTRKTVTAVLVTLVAATCLASAGATTTAVGNHHADAVHAKKEWKASVKGDVVLAAAESRRKKEW